jgi:hypothetical protein
MDVQELVGGLSLIGGGLFFILMAYGVVGVSKKLPKPHTLIVKLCGVLLILGGTAKLVYAFFIA